MPHFNLHFTTSIAAIPMERALQIVPTLSLADLIQLLIIIANRIQLLNGQANHVPPPPVRPARAPGICGCDCMICGAPCGRQKPGHAHHRCYQHRNQ